MVRRSPLCISISVFIMGVDMFVCLSSLTFPTINDRYNGVNAVAELPLHKCISTAKSLPPFKPNPNETTISRVNAESEAFSVGDEVP